MKRSDTTLLALKAAAVVVAFVAIAATAGSIFGLGRQQDFWRRKLSELSELNLMLREARLVKAAVAAHEQWPPIPPSLDGLIQSNLQGVAVAPWVTSSQPLVGRWYSRRVTVTMADVPGEALQHFLDAAASARPPWSLETCSLLSSSVSGRLAQVELVLVGVERGQTSGE